MNREEMHEKLDKLLDAVDELKDKAEDKLYDAKIGAEVVAQDLQNIACRNANRVKDQIVDSELDIRELMEKLDEAKANGDLPLMERCSAALEKYSTEMLGIAQEAFEKAAKAAADAKAARERDGK